MVGDIGNIDQARKEIRNLRMRLSHFKDGINADGSQPGVSPSQSLQSNESSRIAELTARIVALEQENVSLRKLVDPLLLSRIKSLVNVNDEKTNVNESVLNTGRPLLRASMDGN